MAVYATGSLIESKYATGSLEPQSISGGTSIAVDDSLSTTSTNPVQNKVITNKINSLNFMDGGTVVEGLFSELPQFIAGLSGKMSNGTITYKITQDETIDMSVLPDFYGSVGITVPQWNIPEVVIDGNNKSITINSSNPHVPCVAFAPADYNMNTGKLITNLNSKYQVIKIKDIAITGTPQNTNLSVLFNSSDINLKVENCSITCTTEGSVIACEDGLNEIYTTTITSQGSTVANNCAISSVNMSSVKNYNNTFNNIGTETRTKNGGRVQSNNELYDGITFEGKFSDLPTFFASLEGESLNGIVTCKITEDETLTSPLSVQIDLPFKIIVDGNNKTITNNIQEDYRGCSISFVDDGVFSSLRIINLNLVGQGKTSTYKLQGLGFLYPNNNVYVENCTFTNFSFTGINTTSANINCDNCTFSNSDFGFYSSRGSNNFCHNSSFSNITTAFSVEKGSIVRSYNNTFTSVNANYLTANDSKTTGSFYVYNS